MIRFAIFMIVAITLFTVVEAVIFDTIKRSEEALCVRWEQREVQRLREKDGVKYVDRELVDFCTEKVYPFH